jgi:hypothetical protein
MTAEITPAPGQIWRETASGQCVTIESVDAAGVTVADDETTRIVPRAGFLAAFACVHEHWETEPPEAEAAPCS